MFFCWALLPYYICDGIEWSGIVCTVATGFVMDLHIVGQSAEEAPTETPVAEATPAEEAKAEEPAAEAAPAEEAASEEAPAEEAPAKEEAKKES